MNEIALFQMFPLIMSPAMSAILRPDGGAVDPSFLKLLVRHLVAVCFSPSDFIIEEGDQGNEVYFLASGILDVLKGKTTVATTLKRAARALVRSRCSCPTPRGRRRSSPEASATRTCSPVNTSRRA